MAKGFEKAKELHKMELYNATDQIISWYQTLVLASSYVFEIENHLRKQRLQAEN
jgi:hypothetical protein